jgi:hypothetical protein
VPILSPVTSSFWRTIWIHLGTYLEAALVCYSKPYLHPNNTLPQHIVIDFHLQRVNTECSCSENHISPLIVCSLVCRFSFMSSFPIACFHILKPVLAPLQCTVVDQPIPLRPRDAVSKRIATLASFSNSKPTCLRTDHFNHYCSTLAPPPTFNAISFGSPPLDFTQLLFS